MSKRSDILTAVDTRLKTIAIASGYQTNIGSRVFYWQDLPFEYGETGAITFRDPAEEIVKANQFHEKTLNLEIEAIAFVTDQLAGSEALIADLIKAVGEDRTWGKLAHETRLSRTLKNFETDGKTAARVCLEIQIIYRVPLFEA